MQQQIFKTILGISPRRIKPTVILSPLLYPKHFGVKGPVLKSVQGFLTVDLGKITLIKVPMSQGAIKDAVRLLKGTRCRQLIFVGAIGGLEKSLGIGDVLVTGNPKHIFSFACLTDETRESLLKAKKRGALGIDFESEALFAAAQEANLSLTAYYVVTDLPLKKPFYMKRTKREKELIAEALDQITKLISG